MICSILGHSGNLICWLKIICLARRTDGLQCAFTLLKARFFDGLLTTRCLLRYSQSHERYLVLREYTHPNCWSNTTFITHGSWSDCSTEHTVLWEISSQTVSQPFTINTISESDSFPKNLLQYNSTSVVTWENPLHGVIWTFLSSQTQVLIFSSLVKKKVKREKMIVIRFQI